MFIGGRRQEIEEFGRADLDDAAEIDESGFRARGAVQPSIEQASVPALQYAGTEACSLTENDQRRFCFIAA
jgi:hypothetical protein